MMDDCRKKLFLVIFCFFFFFLRIVLLKKDVFRYFRVKKEESIGELALLAT